MKTTARVAGVKKFVMDLRRTSYFMSLDPLKVTVPAITGDNGHWGEARRHTLGEAAVLPTGHLSDG